MYGNVLTAGQTLTSGGAQVPVSGVANVSPLIGQAGNLAANIAGGAQGYYDQAEGYLANVAGAMGNAAGYTNASTAAYDPQSYKAYMDPYQKEVIDQYTKEMQQQFAKTGQQRAASAISSGAFGGGREGVVEAEAQKGFSGELGKGIAGLLSSGYQSSQQQAQQNFQNLMDRYGQAAGYSLGAGELGLGAGQGFGTLGTQYGGTMGGIANTMTGIGVTGQQAEQDKYNQIYQNQMNQYMQPFNQLSFMMQLLGGQGGGISSLYNNPATTGGNPIYAGINALGQMI